MHVFVVFGLDRLSP